MASAAEYEAAGSVAEVADVAQAKRALGVDRLILQIHDASFPCDADEEGGRGSPYSRGAERFFAFAARLGFDTVQLGPQGLTQRGNASPYDATLFSRNPLNLPLGRLVEQGRLPAASLDAVRALPPDGATGRISYASLFDAYQRVLAELASRAGADDRRQARQFLARHAAWLVPDALYDALCVEHAAVECGEWQRSGQGRLDARLFDPPAGRAPVAARRLSELKTRYARQIEDYALVQWLLDAEHRALRRRLAPLGLLLFGDLQVGPSPRDVWAWRHLFLDGYRLGAPPSRTNPAGQPWGYPVLDPSRYGSLKHPGPVLQFVTARLDRMLQQCDGVRIDHPHGWIDPWVYRADDPDPFRAVQQGARLFSSPDDSQHPRLAAWSAARPQQIDRSLSAWADGRVTSLDAPQVARYALLVDAIVQRMVAHGRPPSALGCEVLSTLPYPVGRALARHQLGRFRVIQKADLDRPDDVYRVENVSAGDWAMLGNHDTPPIWALARDWCGGPQGARWGNYLAAQLRPPLERQVAAATYAAHPAELVHAMFAAVLASRARHVLVFFPDLFGKTARYNEPGVVNEANWSLRIPADFEQLYAQRLQSGQALSVRRCLALALRARQPLGT